MAKRFTASEKWDDPWFCSLNPIEKLFWLYVLDKCDHAGLWQANWPLVKFHLGEIPDLSKFEGRLSEIERDRYFIQKFIEFQYKSLNPANKVHQSIISKLEKQGACKPLGSPLQGAKDKDKEKDKDKDKDKVPNLEEVRSYCLERNNGVNPEAWINHYQAKGWMIGKSKMRDWKAAVRTWEKNETAPQQISKPSPHEYIAEIKRKQEERAKERMESFE